MLLYYFYFLFIIYKCNGIRIKINGIVYEGFNYMVFLFFMNDYE